MQIKEKIDACTDDIVAAVARLVRIKSCNAPACAGMPYGEGCAQAMAEALAIASELGF